MEQFTQEQNTSSLLKIFSLNLCNRLQGVGIGNPYASTTTNA